MRTESVQIENFIDGEFVEAVSGKYLDNIEPATGKPYSQVPDSDARDVDLAVDAAEKAFTEWSKKTAGERSSFLLRIADLIERDLEKFARAESIDTGKPISLARSLDIPRAIANFRFFATAILFTIRSIRSVAAPVENPKALPYRTLSPTAGRVYNGSRTGDLLSLTDGKNQITRWSYDQFGRVTNKTDQAGAVVLTYSYDANNRLASRWSGAKGTTASTEAAAIAFRSIR